MTKTIHWFEAKQLDRVTNYSTEIEVIKSSINKNIQFYYYCTFKKNKIYYNLDQNIIYLGVFKNRILKMLEFHIRVFFKSIQLILTSRNNIIIVNQDLIKHVLISFILNKVTKRNNKFIVDIRTTPTEINTFEKDMNKFHSNFKYAAKYFDGLSFITPYMEKYVMKKYGHHNKIVNWSSGVDTTIFNFKKFKKNKNKNKFSVFYHGGISESRGNLILIKACELLVKKGIAIELIQIGICVDKSINEYILCNKLDDWCKILSPIQIEEIPQYIANCDLPVLPFPNFIPWRVSSPIKLMEYMAMGKKVLAPKYEAFTDVFKDKEEFIYYFEPNNSNLVNEISDNIEKIIIEKNINNYSEKELVDFVTQNYTWEIQANKLLNFCQSL